MAVFFACKGELIESGFEDNNIVIGYTREEEVW
jgi:hypothetical protein